MEITESIHTGGEVVKYLILTLGIFGIFELGLRGYAAWRYPQSSDDYHRIICVGDSVVYGAGSTNKAKSFPSVLSNLMGEPVLNAGALSATSDDALIAVKELVRLKPEIIIVHVGYNDHKFSPKSEYVSILRRSYLFRFLAKPFDGRKMNLEDWKENAIDIHMECWRQGIKVYFLTISANPTTDRVDRMNQILMAFDFIPITLEPKHFSNQIHLNDSGYQEMARQVYKQINER